MARHPLIDGHPIAFGDRGQLLRILALLGSDETLELSVGELARALGISQSRVPNQLRHLRDSGLLGVAAGDLGEDLVDEALAGGLRNTGEAEARLGPGIVSIFHVIWHGSGQ